jgi:hypothetical protein
MFLIAHYQGRQRPPWFSFLLPFPLDVSCRYSSTRIAPPRPEGIWMTLNNASDLGERIVRSCILYLALIDLIQLGFVRWLGLWCFGHWGIVHWWMWIWGERWRLLRKWGSRHVQHKTQSKGQLRFICLWADVECREVEHRTSRNWAMGCRTR